MENILARIKIRTPNETEFHQAVHEVVESVKPVLERTPRYRNAAILERLTEPEVMTIFRIPWMDDRGKVQVSTGYRIGMNSAIGPYNGGLGPVLDKEVQRVVVQPKPGVTGYHIYQKVIQGVYQFDRSFRTMEECVRYEAAAKVLSTTLSDPPM